MSIGTAVRNRLWRFISYLWASPATFLGCFIGFLALCFGATWQVVDGAVEVGGGRISSAVRLLPRVMRFEAITFGHIILGNNFPALETHRLHEHMHVRQYERWGPLFFPLYLGSSLLQLLRGLDPHHDNHFERKAYRYAASAAPALSTDRRTHSA